MATKLTEDEDENVFTALSTTLQDIKRNDFTQVDSHTKNLDTLVSPPSKEKVVPVFTASKSVPPKQTLSTNKTPRNISNLTGSIGPKRIRKIQSSEDDFPEFKKSSTQASLSRTIKKVNTPVHSKHSLSTSFKAPSQSSDSNFSSSLPPLSTRLAQIARKAKILSQQNSQESPENIEEMPILSTEANSHDPNILATPPRSKSIPLATGSSCRRKPLYDVGSNTNKLVSLLRTARSRVKQEWGEMAVHQSASNNTGIIGFTSLILKVKEIEIREADFYVLTCYIVERAGEENLKIGDTVSCIVPLFSTAESQTDDRTLLTLRLLGHIHANQSLESSLLSVYKPWKIISNNNSLLNNVTIICSGLVSILSNTL